MPTSPNRAPRAPLQTSRLGNQDSSPSSSPPKDGNSPTRLGGLLNSVRGTGGTAADLRAQGGSPTRNSPTRARFDNSGDDETSIISRGMNDLQLNKENSNPMGDNYHPRNELSAKDYAIVDDPKVQRLVNVAQLYFYDYYFDLMTYIYNRNQRLNKAKSTLEQLPPEERESQWKSYTGRERVQLRKRRVKMKYGDFKILTQIGQGGYGQVFLAQKADTKEICALKVLNKKLLLKLDEIRHILTERDILTASKSPWLVSLLYSFQDQENVFLAMSFESGGDFRSLLNNTGILSPRHTRFYVSEMFAGTNELHRIGYIHRDLKPENFLIDASGHIKLTDFGLASGAISQDRVESMRIRLDQVKDMQVPYRSVTERQNLYKSMRNNINYANSIVGSPDYMALEVLQGKDYNFTIDYWSLGCMLFETLAGYPPFAGGTSEETYANLQQWKRTLRRPQYEDGKFVFSDRTWDLIQRLITSPRYRFNSFEEIKQHAYFAEVDWPVLRQSSPPFVPQLDSEADAGYFDDFSNESDMAKYKEVMDKKNQVESLAEKGSPLPTRAFIGFTYKHSKNSNVPLMGEDSVRKSQRERNVMNDTSFGTIL